MQCHRHGLRSSITCSIAFPPAALLFCLVMAFAHRTPSFLTIFLGPPLARLKMMRLMWTYLIPGHDPPGLCFLNMRSAKKSWFWTVGKTSFIGKDQLFDHPLILHCLAAAVLFVNYFPFPIHQTLILCNSLLLSSFFNHLGRVAAIALFVIASCVVKSPIAADPHPSF